MTIRNYLPIFKYFFHILFIKVIKKQYIYAIGHYHKKMSNTTCFELKIQCPPSQLCLQTISLFTSLFTRESESDSGHQKYIVDFQRFPVSLTK